ncbi:MAG TPA: hypothetical protein VFI31_02575 [Pirellulales bacterium]|nr:hypothetical protein [Pirellulales bacterium]
MAMRCLLLASIVFLALGVAAESASGGWRTDGAANRTSTGVVWQRGMGPMGYGWYSVPGDWRTYGVANKISYNGVWWRGYGWFGYGWYSVYGAFVGNDYSTIGYGYGGFRNPSSGFNFNRIDNYGFVDPRAIGERAR